MKPTLALDIYGTLISPHGIASALHAHVGEQSMAVAVAWRDKQLEYSFRRGLMRVYTDFSECTRQALDYVCDSMNLRLSESSKTTLLEQYRRLPAFPDVPETLAALAKAGYRMYAFSNGFPDDLAALLSHAGIANQLDGIVSVHDVASFKPNPDVYAHFLAAAHTTATQTWLVSSNPFDVIGARAVGWNAAWVQRDPKSVFDPWGIEPTVVVDTLAALPEALCSSQQSTADRERRCPAHEERSR